MKKILAILVISTSINAYALQAFVATEVGGSLIFSTVGGMTTAGKECEIMVCKEAVQVVNDAQNYLQTGEISIFLALKLNETQLSHESLSEIEALDLVIENALTVLK